MTDGGETTWLNLLIVIYEFEWQERVDRAGSELAVNPIGKKGLGPPRTEIGFNGLYWLPKSLPSFKYINVGQSGFGNDMGNRTSDKD